MRDAGFEVRPDAGLMGRPGAELDAALSGALAFVQIVSPMLCELSGDSETTYDYVQLEAARARGLKTFRWRASDLNLKAGAQRFPGYKDFATAADVREQLLPIFKADLVGELKALRAARRVRHGGDGDERVVLIAGEERDIEDHADILAERLKGHALGHFITKSPEEEIRADDVRGFLVLYGNGKAERVRDWLALRRKLPKSRQQALRVGVYFCAPPPDIDGRPLLYDAPSIQRIRWDDQPSLDAFATAITQ